MNFKHLHYFWVAARAGGVVKAGEQLHTTPQTVSGQIPYAAIPMPGGGQARVWADPDADAKTGPATGRPVSRTLVVRYDSQALGRLDVVLRLDDERLEAALLAPAGESLARLRSAVPELRAALMGATERPVSVSTGGRTGKDADVRA